VNVNDAIGGGSSGFVPYALMSGTSMATPHVVGATALLFSACPAATPLDAMRAIMAGAVRDRVHKTGSDTAVTEPFEAGYGGLDVERSMNWLMEDPKCGFANAAPTASFTAPVTVRNFEAATFDAGASSDSDGTLAAHAWDFGDGGTADGAIVKRGFDWPGVYDVRLTVTDDEGATASTTRTVIVRDEPAAGLKRVTAAQNNVRCSKRSWTFSVTGATPQRIAVRWADGGRSLLPLSGTTGSGKSQQAVYTTTTNLATDVLEAKADVPQTWKGSFTTVSGPGGC
jgi:PKD repeat protein